MSATNETPRNAALSALAYEEQTFPALRLARVARTVRRLGRWLLVTLLLCVAAAVFAPWQQSVLGQGAAVALDPFERPQVVQAPVKGVIAERGEGVQEGAYVTKGQLLFRIEDQDPLYLSRLEQQVAAVQNVLDQARMRLAQSENLLANNKSIVEIRGEELTFLEAAREELMAANNRFVEQAKNKLAAAQSKQVAAEAKLWQLDLDLKRNEAAAEDGLVSQLDLQKATQLFREAEANVSIAKQGVEEANNGVEGKINERESKRNEWDAKIQKVNSELEKARADVAKAEIDINKTREEINNYQAKLLDQERKFEVQKTQEVKAPRDGYIMNLSVVDAASIVKEGQALCRIVPRTDNPAVEVWVSGNDAPLIAPGRHTRLQFEGWPAVQFSGWPSVAVGTFGGEVAIVDPTDDGAGKFRVVIVPDPECPPWPEHPFLRQGVRSKAWVLLDQVPLGFEIWRRMNGFPQSIGAVEQSKAPKPPKLKI